MQQNTTGKETSGPHLPPQQIRALVALLGGARITAAAEASGVDRTTVHRWLREDWHFQAALNRGRRELKDAIEARLLCLAEQAAETVEQAIQRGDSRAALSLLKGLGLLGKQPIAVGTDDPDALQAEAARRKEEAAIAEQEARFERTLRFA